MALLLLTAPIVIVAMALVRLTSRGPALYKQERLGLGGEVFTIYKIRTMHQDSERHGGATWSLPGDPRITPVGRVLRSTHLDELPQLINVVMGEMSLVGPRPERPELAEQLAMAIPYFEERMRDVKPGITGLAQISLGYSGKPLPDSMIKKFEADLTNPFKVEGAEDALADHMRMKLLYDLAYSAATEDLKEFLLLELSIIIKTPLVMLGARGT